MIYIKCSKCSSVHNTFLSDSFSTCSCGGQMRLIRVTDKQHQKAMSALQEYLEALVTSSLERVQKLTKGKKIPDEYESWSANWLLKSSDARSREGIESIYISMYNHRDANEGDEIFEAADWAVLTADAAERAISWFEEGKVYDMLWWLSNAVHNSECVKSLKEFQDSDEYAAKKAEVIALLKENGYEVVI